MQRSAFSPLRPARLPARLSDSLVPVTLHAMRQAACGLPALPVPAPIPSPVLAVMVRRTYGRATLQDRDLPRGLDSFA